MFEPLKSFLKLLLFGNIYVAFGAVGLVYSTGVQMKIPFTQLWVYILLVFSATLIVYNLQRIFYASIPASSGNSKRRIWIAKNQFLVKLFALVGLGGLVVSLLFHSWQIVLYMGPVLLLSILYFSFLNLRNTALSKLLTLVMVWVLVSAVVPIQMYAAQTNIWHYWLHVIGRFCFMAAICIPFDSRDLAIDAADNIDTIPQRIGERNSRWLALFFVFIHLVVLLLEWQQAYIDDAQMLALFLSGMATSVIVYYSSSDKSDYYYVLGLDGTMLMQGMAIWLTTLNS